MDITKRTLTTTEESVLKNDLLDVQDWVTKAIDGKVNNCKKRMLAEWLPNCTLMNRLLKYQLRKMKSWQ